MSPLEKVLGALTKIGSASNFHGGGGGAGWVKIERQYSYPEKSCGKACHAKSVEVLVHKAHVPIVNERIM